MRKSLSSAGSVTLLLVGLAFVLAACEDGDGGIIRDEFPLTSAVVFGEVSGADGAPVGDATVTVEGWRVGCPDEGGSGPLPGPQGVTESDGTYRLVFEERGLDPQELCLLVRAEPPAGASSGAAADTGASVMLREEPPVDSVRVDLSLP